MTNAYLLDISPDRLQGVLRELADSPFNVYVEGPEAARMLIDMHLSSKFTLVIPYTIPREDVPKDWMGSVIKKGVGHYTIAIWAARNLDILMVEDPEKAINQSIIREAEKYGAIIAKI